MSENGPLGVLGLIYVLQSKRDLFSRFKVNVVMMILFRPAAKGGPARTYHEVTFAKAPLPNAVVLNPTQTPKLFCTYVAFAERG